MESVEQGAAELEASLKGTPGVNGTPEYDKGDLEARLRNEPDFAVQEYKKLQSTLSREQQRNKQLAKLAQAAQIVGGDNLEAGADALLGYVERQYRIEQDPTMKKYVEEWLNTGQVPSMKGEDLDADETYLTPEEKKIRDLEETVAQLRQRVDSTDLKTARGEIQTRVKEFFNSDIGQYLNDEEKAEIFRSFERQFDQWSATHQGRQQLSNITPKTIRLIAADWLMEHDKFDEIGERKRLRKLEHRKSASTDGPSDVAARETGREGVSPKQVMVDLAKDLGIDLYKPLVR